MPRVTPITIATMNRLIPDLQVTRTEWSPGSTSCARPPPGPTVGMLGFDPKVPRGVGGRSLGAYPALRGEPGCDADWRPPTRLLDCPPELLPWVSPENSGAVASMRPCPAKIR
jgi:hypothetical protein